MKIRWSINIHSCWIIGFGLSNFLCPSVKHTSRNVLFYVQPFQARATSIFQSTVPVLEGCCVNTTTAAPQWCLQSQVKSSTFTAAVCFYCSFQQQKSISVDIIVFQTKGSRPVYMSTHPVQKPQTLLGAYLHLASVCSSEIRWQFKIHRPPRINIWF